MGTGDSPPGPEGFNLLPWPSESFVHAPPPPAPLIFPCGEQETCFTRVRVSPAQDMGCIDVPVAMLCNLARQLALSPCLFLEACLIPLHPRSDLCSKR